MLDQDTLLPDEYYLLPIMEHPMGISGLVLVPNDRANYSRCGKFDLNRGRRNGSAPGDPKDVPCLWVRDFEEVDVIFDDRGAGKR
jgi:hypothetical protein